MKLLTLASLLITATSAFAQSNAKAVTAVDLEHLQKMSTQAGCPVVFTDVALHRKAHMMLVKQGTSSGDDLAFQYENKSGKEIQSISVSAELNVKKSVYDLDATTLTLNMTLTGHEAAETLPLSVLAYGLNRVTLEQVAYTDGTVWDAGAKEAKTTCSYQNQHGSEQIGKLQ